MSIYIRIYLRVCLCVLMCKCLHVFVCMCVHVCACKTLCMCVHALCAGSALPAVCNITECWTPAGTHISRVLCPHTPRLSASTNSPTKPPFAFHLHRDDPRRPKFRLTLGATRPATPSAELFPSGFAQPILPSPPPPPPPPHMLWHQLRSFDEQIRGQGDRRKTRMRRRRGGGGPAPGLHPSPWQQETE